MTHERKCLLWAVSCIALRGSFRIHELLSREELYFDQTYTLFGKNTRVVKAKINGENEEIWIKHFKNPKEDK